MWISTAALVVAGGGRPLEIMPGREDMIAITALVHVGDGSRGIDAPTKDALIAERRARLKDREDAIIGDADLEKLRLSVIFK